MAGAQRRFVCGVVCALMLVLGSPPARASQTVDPLDCQGWADNVVGPSQRSVQPMRAQWSDGEPLDANQWSALLQTDGASVRVAQPGRALVLDFGQVVSGKLEVDTVGASGTPLVLSTSESLAFLAPGGDTQAYGNGDLRYQPGGGIESWHAFVRRTFRYVLLRPLETGWVDLDRVGVYFTAELGPASAFQGYFQSSDALLNRIWYQSAYTLQLVTAPGTAGPYDGTFEIWRSMLDVAAPRESRLLLVRPGDDWQDIAFNFDLLLNPESAGGGWALGARHDGFLAFRVTVPHADQPSVLQLWQRTPGSPPSLVIERRLPFMVRPGRTYHVRVETAGNRIVNSIDGQVVSTDTVPDLRGGRVGFWAAGGDAFDVRDPQVAGPDGALLFEDVFDGPYLDPARWQDPPQPLLLDGAKRDRAVGMADVAIAARGEYSSFLNRPLIARLLAATAAQQYPDGKLPGGLAVGSDQAPEDDNLPDYTLWWVQSVADYVLHTGDVDTLRSLFPHVEAALDWAERKRQPDRLLPKGPGEDWYWSASRGSGPTASLNVLYADTLQRASELAEVAGRSELSERYARQGAELREVVNRSFWDAEAGAYIDGDRRDHHPLDANALAVRFGIANADRAHRVLSFISDRLWTPAGSLTADAAYGAWAHDDTIWPAYVYSEVEARFTSGDDAGALEALRRTWGAMLAHDPASTFWEFATREGTIHDGSVSLAHGWSTGALPALSRWMLGVRPLKPGFAEYTLDPHAGDVAWACGAAPTPMGAIRVAWQRSGAAVTAWVDAPAGTLGHVAAEDGTVATLEPGRHLLELAGEPQ